MVGLLKIHTEDLQVYSIQLLFWGPQLSIHRVIISNLDPEFMEGKCYFLCWMSCNHCVPEGIHPSWSSTNHRGNVSLKDTRCLVNMADLYAGIHSRRITFCRSTKTCLLHCYHLDTAALLSCMPVDVPRTSNTIHIYYQHIHSLSCAICISYTSPLI